MRRIAKMPLWAESRIHGDVYVRFGGERLETYRPKGRGGRPKPSHRKVAWRRQPSLRITNKKIEEDMLALAGKLDNFNDSINQIKK